MAKKVQISGTARRTHGPAAGEPNSWHLLSDYRPNDGQLVTVFDEDSELAILATYDKNGNAFRDRKGRRVNTRLWRYRKTV